MKWIKRASAAMTLIVAACLIATTSVVPKHQVHNWLTLRADQYLTQHLYLIPYRPVELHWDTHRVRFVLIPLDHAKPQNGCRVVMQIDDQPMRVLNSDAYAEREALMFDGVKAVELYEYFYPYMPLQNVPGILLGSVYSTLQIFDRPSKVIGFAKDEPMSDDAQAFLDEARALIGQ